jgi:hypothetical protein
VCADRTCEYVCWVWFLLQGGCVCGPATSLCLCAVSRMTGAGRKGLQHSSLTSCSHRSTPGPVSSRSRQQAVCKKVLLLWRQGC